MPAPGSTRSLTSQRGLLVALTIVAATQRFSLAEVPPISSLIGEQASLDSFGIGLATTLTVVMMALGSPLAAALDHRLSREWIIVCGAAAVVVGCAIRAVPPLSITLFLGSIIGGLGIAAVGTMVPGVIAERLPHRVGIAVGSTTFALTLVAVLVSSFTAPLATRWGTTAALAAWAVPALIALLIWLPYARHTRPATGGRNRLPWRSGSAWLSVALMTAQSITYIIALAWVAPSYQEAGMSLDAAGFLLGTVTLGNMLGAMSAPVIAHRFSDRRPLLMVTVLLTGFGAVYLAVGATTATVPAMLAFGLGLGGGFGIALALLNDLGATPRSTASLSAMTFLFAYLISAPCAAVGGWLHDSTGNFSAVWWVVVATAVAMIPLTWTLGPRRRNSVPEAALESASPR